MSVRRTGEYALGAGGRWGVGIPQGLASFPARENDDHVWRARRLQVMR